MKGIVQQLRRYRQEILAELNSEKILKKFWTLLEQYYQGQCSVTIYVWREDLGRFAPLHEEDPPDKKRFFVYEDIILWLGDQDRLFARHHFQTFEELAHIRQTALQFLERTEGYLVAPLSLHRSLLAFVVFSEKHHGQVFRPAELRYLDELRSATTIALSNASLYERLEAFNRSLEERIIERTKELQEAQAILSQNEKLASLGVMVAGIAHEINTPAGVVNGAIENIGQQLEPLFDEILRAAGKENLSREIYPSFAEAITLSKTPLSASDKFIRAKKIRTALEATSFATLPDIERRIAFILEYRLEHRQDDIMALAQDDFSILEKMLLTKRNIGNIRNAIGNIIRIVKALKYYSHLDQSATDEADLREGIDNTLVILHNQLKHRITVIRTYEKVPPIRCIVGELNQIWTNLIMNAVQAISGEGKIYVSLSRHNYAVLPEPGTVLDEERMSSILAAGGQNFLQKITITDNGPGIPEHLKFRIFDPFFTTKKPGEGTGLGLGIVKNIVKRHGGVITLHSEPGLTRFSIYIPENNPFSE